MLTVVLVFVASGAIAYLTTLHYLSRRETRRLVSFCLQQSGLNVVTHEPILSLLHPDELATIQQTPGICPDLAYTSCVFDLSHGPLRLQLPSSFGDYWSVACYGAASESFYCASQDGLRGVTELVLTYQPRGLAPRREGHVVNVTSTARRGLVMVRMLLRDESCLPALQLARESTRVLGDAVGHEPLMESGRG
jgi:uncharacterized membrane protein